MPPTSFRTFVIVAAAALATLFILSSSTRQVASHAASAVKPAKFPSLDLEVPTKFNWYHSAHKPPEQKNSSHGDTSWHADWRWLNPFSSSVTLDEDRALLPPLPERPFIYTYYDATVKRDRETKKVDLELIRTWRRAWWAKGFRPVVVTQAEAMANPLYRELAPKGMPKALEFEFSRWLAWSHMGTGLLADVYCVPMGAYDDDLLTHLRRGDFAQLTKFDGLGSGLFAGNKVQVDSAVKDALNDARLSTFKAITEAIKTDLFRVEQPTSLAYYDSQIVQKRYPAIANEIIRDPVKGRRQLNKLIISHLHIIWQNTFSSGIEVLKPLPAHTTALVEPSIHLAQLLAECPETLLPSSCPPNKPKCTPCVGSRMRITTPEAFRNSSSLYTIATVPHPYTMITLNNQSSEITTAHIRRKTDRDAWIYSVTRDVLGDGRGGPSRVIALKDAVAGSFGQQRSLWFTVEHFPANVVIDINADKVPTNDVQDAPVDQRTPFPENWLDEMAWHFGFEIPRTTVSHGESMNPVPLPGDQRWQKGQQGIPADKKGSYDPPDPTESQQMVEAKLLKKARDTINSNDKHLKQIRDVAEKWNLADLEAWKFVKAFRARIIVEKELFEEEESKFDGSSGARGGRWW